MIHRNKRLKYALLTPLFLIASVVLSFAHVQFASAATLTWTGDGDGTTFADGDNWSTDSAPVDGDIIQFAPLAGGTDNQTIYLENDLTGVSLGGLVSTTAGSGNSKYFYIDTLTFEDGATVSKTGTDSKIGLASMGTSGHLGEGTITAEGDLTVTASLSGTFDVDGNLTANGTSGFVALRNNSSVSGNLIMKNGMLYTTGLSIGGSITLPANNKGVYIKGPSKTFTNTVTINDFDDSLVLNQLGAGNCAAEPTGGSGGAGAFPIYVSCNSYATATYTFSGTVTLNADLVVAVASKSTVNFSGTLNKNGHTITKQTDHGEGTLKVGSSSVTIPEKTTKITDNKPNDNVTVSNKETTYVNGTRGIVLVNAGGTLKGSGTADQVYVSDGGFVNPGNSPGKLTISSTMNLSSGATYKAEVLNSSKYDQLRVGDDYSTPGGHAVTLDDGALLKVVLYDGWSIKKNDKFTLIDNRSDTDIQGTFNNLDEGDQFEVTNEGKTITFSITYEGGDGNDVVITALNSGSDPTPPNTGAMKLNLANPIVLAVLGALTAGILVLIAVRRHARQ